MDFALYLLLNAVLILRPEELFPSLAGMRLYYVAICGTLLASAPKLLPSLAPAVLRERPVVVCGLGVWAAGVLSLVVRGRADGAFEFATEIGKVVLYFLLTVAVLDTPARFRAFAGCLVVLYAGMTALCVATYHGAADFESLAPVMQREFDPAVGSEVWLPRLVGSGVYNDPNDVCLALVYGGLCAAYLGTTGPRGPRLLWLSAIPLFFYAVTLTHSRGGMLGLLAAVGAYLFAAFGRGRGLILAAAAGGIVLMAVGGRGANISGGGTAHERLMLWAYGLGDLFNSPRYLLTGMGVGYYVEEWCYVAHNSFVTTYVETGLLGGGFFLVAFLTAFRQSLAADPGSADWVKPARRLAAAAVAGYAVGAYSVSKPFAIPTYMVLGLAAAFARLSTPDTPERFRLTPRFWKRAAWLAVGGLLFLKYFTQVSGMLGV